MPRYDATRPDRVPGRRGARSARRAIHQAPVGLHEATARWA